MSVCGRNFVTTLAQKRNSVKFYTEYINKWVLIRFWYLPHYRWPCATFSRILRIDRPRLLLLESARKLTYTLFSIQKNNIDAWFVCTYLTLWWEVVNMCTRSNSVLHKKNQNIKVFSPNNNFELTLRISNLNFVACISIN